jgi:hypothetical protein
LTNQVTQVFIAVQSDGLGNSLPTRPRQKLLWADLESFLHKASLIKKRFIDSIYSRPQLILQTIGTKVADSNQAVMSPMFLEPILLHPCPLCHLEYGI